MSRSQRGRAQPKMDAEAMLKFLNRAIKNVFDDDTQFIFSEKRGERFRLNIGQGTEAKSAAIAKIFSDNGLAAKSTFKETGFHVDIDLQALQENVSLLTKENARAIRAELGNVLMQQAAIQSPKNTKSHVSSNKLILQDLQNKSHSQTVTNPGVRYSQFDYDFSQFEGKDKKTLKRLQDNGCEFPKLVLQMTQASRTEEALIVEAIRVFAQEFREVKIEA